MSSAKKRLKDSAPCEIQMTPMIDVVFQLLIYFIVTIKPIPIRAHLDVNRPSADKPSPGATVPNMIKIQIFQGALVMNDSSMNLESLTDVLTKLAKLSKTQTVLIMCARDSEHDMLINVLDRCAKTGLSNLQVVSMAE